MTGGNRILSTFVLLGLLTLNLSGVAQSQNDPSAGGPHGTFVISGMVGLAHATVQGLPGGKVSTDENGFYSAEVPQGWAGTVTPIKVGYAFVPPSRIYTAIAGSHENQDYTATLIMYRISGTAGVPGVRMVGLPQEVVTDSRGEYSAMVSYGWSGTVVPEKEGYRFEPSTKRYARLERDMTNESYAATVVTFTISGRTGVPGVLMKGLPREPVTDREGFYKAQVPFGWSGVVRPSKEGLSFTPPERTYDSVTASLSDENYAVGERMVTISDVIKAGNVLVIPTGDTSAEKIAETTEDLRVMLQILREKLSEPRMILGVLRDYGSLLGEDRRAEAIYLQGSAALFVIGADFPPSSPTQQPGEGEPPTQSQGEAADPVWQRVRQKLYSPGARSPSPSGQTQTMTFEQFKEELLRSLRHATNLRHIDPNELVVLTLVAQNEGASRAGESDVMKQYANIYGNDYMAMMGAGRTAVATTVLTMQARKADIDAFAQGTLDFDQFRRKVKSLIY